MDRRGEIVVWDPMNWAKVQRFSLNNTARIRWGLDGRWVVGPYIDFYDGHIYIVLGCDASIVMWAGYPWSTRKYNLYWLGNQCTNPGSSMTLSFPIYHFRRCGSIGLQASRVICVADFTRREPVIMSWRRRFAELVGYIGIPTSGSDFAVRFFVPWIVNR